MMLSLWLSIPGAAAAEQTLFSFEPGFDPKIVRCTDAKIAVERSGKAFGLQIKTGHTQSWPGITLPATGGHWNLSAFSQVIFLARNDGTNSLTLYCRVDNPGADGTKHCVTESLTLNPGQTSTLHVSLPHATGSTLGGKLFGMRGYPVTNGGPDALDTTNITQILIFVSQPKENHSFEVGAIRADGEYLPPTASVSDADPFFPFIDTFGQYRHKNWTGKVHSLAELAQRRQSESAELAANPGPPGWDRYGGDARGPQLDATGFFRTKKLDGKWWFVDPDGHLFWSQGIDCVRMLEVTPIEDRAAWFEDFPGEQPEFREFISSGHSIMGYYEGRNPKTFSFAGANLKRKYGGDWRHGYPEIIHRRLRSWGLNTIGNWSDPAICMMRRTPYTDSIVSYGSKQIEGSEGYWGRFPDVFDSSFAEALRRSMDAKTNSSLNDPWCIGYFSDNEMSWGDETSLALAALKSPPAQAAKREFLNDLKAKFSKVTKLNAAWGTDYASWDAILESRKAPDNGKAREDLIAFNTKIAETYFRTVCDTIKSATPHQLYLGCRFAWVNDDAARAAGKYCDVVSYNLYHRSIAGFKYPGGDKPLMVGEFHFGALDRGMFHSGLVPVDNQEARAAAYRDYVLGALHHPQIVGTHWFQWQDEPVTGRVLDGENYQIGFIDVADTPYSETIRASRELGLLMYETRLSDK